MLNTTGTHLFRVFTAIANWCPSGVFVSEYFDHQSIAFTRTGSGADPGAILRFKRYQTFISFLKLDFEAGALTIALGSFYLYSSIHTWVIIASILVTFGWPLLGAASAKVRARTRVYVCCGAGCGVDDHKC